MLAKQVKGIEKELAQARERYEHDSYEESDQLSHFTENIFEDIDSGDEEVKDEVKLDENEDKSIDEEEVNKFILNEEEQRIKKGIWIQHNSAWL